MEYIYRLCRIERQSQFYQTSQIITEMLLYVWNIDSDQVTIYYYPQESTQEIIYRTQILTKALAIIIGDWCLKSLQHMNIVFTDYYLNSRSMTKW